MTARAVVLTKDEEANIGRCVRALRRCGLAVLVLDSGSADDTVAIAKAGGAEIEVRRYRDHCDSYNYVCLEKAAPGEPLIVVDADMVVSPELASEALDLMQAGRNEVVSAPILMCWNGTPLRHGSLCPNKPFAFKAGRDYFEPIGHGEKLRGKLRLGTTRNRLVHDDRKPFEAFLASQGRYASQLQVRAALGSLTWRDRLRRASPLFMVIQPLVSLLVKGGFLSGAAGIGYALDRLIAEAVMYRQSLAGRVRPANRDEAPQ